MLWCKLVRQAQDSLNILRTSRVHPKISAFHALEGAHDFNKHPWAPPATRATIFNPPETRTSWGARAIDAWYIGPAWDHYRCLEFQIPSTGGIRTSGQYQLYPQHCEIPLETPMDGATRVAKDLIEAIRKLQGLEKRNPGRHTAALEKLAKIFKGETDHLPHREDPGPQTSTNPTQPEDIRNTPRAHNKRTRNNTPGILPTVQERRETIATSEGEEVSAEDISPAQQWYAEPREKRTRVRKVSQRKSPRLNKNIISPVEANKKTQDNVDYNQHDVNKVYGLGVPEKQAVQMWEDPTPAPNPPSPPRKTSQLSGTPGSYHRKH